MVDKSYGQKRVAWISRADQLSKLAAQYQTHLKHKSAARNYQRAGELYYMAGLGLLAAESFQFAAAHYEQIGLYGEASTCSSRLDGIDRWNGGE